MTESTVFGRAQTDPGPITLTTYKRTARQYLCQYARYCHPDMIADDTWQKLTSAELALFPGWFVRHEGSRVWCRKTWYNVKSALLFMLSPYIAEQHLAALREFQPRKLTSSGESGSSLREKNPTRRQLLTILSYLDGKDTPLYRLTAAWFRATLASGLRPREWVDACYQEIAGGAVLVVTNGKRKAIQQQSSSPCRRLYFMGREAAAQRDAIRLYLSLLETGLTQMAKSGEHRKKTFHRLLKACGEYLRKANRALRDGRPASHEEKDICLYTARHAFKADAMRMLGSSAGGRACVAALMGHGSVWSQREYAPENNAIGRGSLPLVSADAVAAVRGIRAGDRHDHPNPRRSQPTARVSRQKPHP